MRCLVWLVVAVAPIAMSACATSDGGYGDTEGAGGKSDSGGDDPDDPGSEETVGCGIGSHTCGASCAQDTTNTPEVGCMYGCGEACPGTANGAATCSATGVCELTCNSGYTEINGQCVMFSCAKVEYACGNYINDDGTTFSCGACFGSTVCGTDHKCAVAADGLETNNTRDSATDLGSFNDADNKERTVGNLTIHETTDYDYFKFRVVDGFDGNNPDVRVDLHRPTTLGWLESSHELSVWFKCDSGGDSSVTCGEWYTDTGTNTLNDATMGKGCSVNARYVPYAQFEANCSGTNDSGTAYVRVRKGATFLPRGDKYELFVSVK
jgi:hypothetical protein